MMMSGLFNTLILLLFIVGACALYMEYKMIGDKIRITPGDW